MQKNEFEKQVQQKMEELKLPPSEAVWQNIEARISITRRRKRGWIFFPALLIGLLSGGYFLWHQGNNSQAHHDETSLKISKNKKNINSPAKKLLQKSVAEESTAGKSHHNNSSVKNNTRLERGMVYSQKVKKNNSVKSILQPHKTRIDVISPLPDSQDISINSKKNIIADPTKNKNPVASILQAIEEKEPVTAVEINGSALVTTQIDSLTIQVKTGSLTKNEQAKNETAFNTKAKSVNHIKPKNIWKWGLTFSGGVSGVPNGFLGSLDKSYSYADAYSLNSSPSTQNPNPNVLPSKIKSSGALIAGFFVEKNISKKNMITVGLHYKLLSSTSKVGDRNQSSARDSLSLSNPVNTYHNYFHFIELPVSLKVQITSGKIPLFWDGGISFSQLIGSNALQFDNSAISYYKNNSLFNKTQVGFNTGLSFSLFTKQKAPMLIGPYIYYGTTKIATEGLYKNQHFSFIGLRLQLLLKK